MRPQPQTPEEALERLLERARNAGDCLLVGPSNRYQHVRVAGRYLNAHRAAYIARHGPPPADKPMILHDPWCPNRNCISDAHTRPGNATENAHDLILNGRMLRGEQHPRAKLTTATVVEARRLKARGLPLQAIAARLRVPMSTIGHAIRGTTWKHL